MSTRRRFLELLGAAAVLGFAASPSDLAERVFAASGSGRGALADEINATNGSVSSWDGLTEIGVLMNAAPLSDFDTWISREARAENWSNVLHIKRLCEHAGHSSGAVNASVKLALANVPMFSEYSLPITDASKHGYFWPSERYVLYGYRYARELSCETDRWDATSGFEALRDTRNRYGKPFYRCNPDDRVAESIVTGARWHESGSLMGCFFILGRSGVNEATGFAAKEWDWLNSNLWNWDHFDYAISWPGYEFSGIDVHPNVAKLGASGVDLSHFDRVATDLWARYLAAMWDSPQWHRTQKVAQHHTENPERRLDGTLAAWILLNTFYGSFDTAQRSNLRALLGVGDNTSAPSGLLGSDLKQSASRRYRTTSSMDYSDEGTAQAALCLFLMGVCPLEGGGIAIPLVSDEHVSHASLNFRHFEFDYDARRIKLPVWGGTTLEFSYGTSPVAVRFERDGIYEVRFDSDWNSVSQLGLLCGLYASELYSAPTSADTFGGRIS